MAVTQLFAGSHASAVARARALEAGHATDRALTVELPGLTGPDLEVLGEVAARVVEFGSGDLEPAEVDLDHEQLLRLPDFLVEVLVAVGESEDPETVGEVAAAWAATEEASQTEDELLPLVTAVVELVTEAQEDGSDVYLWIDEA